MQTFWRESLKGGSAVKKHPLRRGVGLVQASSKEIQKNYTAAVSRTLHLTGLSGIGSILLALLKLLSGVLSLSVFTCVNGLYTLGMVLARYCALVGVVRTQTISEQYRYYRWSGVVLIAASGLYIAYSIRMYFHPVYTAYHPYLAMGIATVTFVEIGVNLRGVLVYRKNHTPLLHALKTISLATSLISLVLTQAAILSFADDIPDPAANGILGALMGGCAVLLGIYMLRRLRRITDPADCRREQRAIDRLTRRRFPDYAVTALEKQFTDQGKEVVTVQVAPGADLETGEWAQLCGEAERRFQIQLVKK